MKVRDERESTGSTIEKIDPNLPTWKIIREEGRWSLAYHTGTKDLILEHCCKRTKESYTMVLTNPDGLCYLCQEQAPEGMIAIWKFGNM